MPAGTRGTAHLQVGRRAESLAADYLVARGFSILERNWRRPEAELDLVARDGDTCVFVEIRSRTGLDQGHPLETIDGRKRSQVIRGARLYLHEAQSQAAAYRFDVIGVVFDPEGGAPLVDHVPDAFQIGD